MYGFGYSIPSASDIQSAAKQAQSTVSQAQEIARQAQQAAEQAQQIAQMAQSTAQAPPVPRPPSPVVAPAVRKPSLSESAKTYAIPIIAVSALIVVGVYMLKVRS